MQCRHYLTSVSNYAVVIIRNTNKHCAEWSVSFNDKKTTNLLIRLI